MNLRPLAAEQSLLSRADGSARFSHGSTSVLAAVYGPAEVKQSKEKLNRATIDVVFKPKSGNPGSAEKLIEKILRETCETIIISSLHPRSSISIIVQLEHDDGALIACSVNACYLALLDAGIPMSGQLSAVGCSFKDECILDPSLEQVQDSSSVLTLVFDSHSHLIASHGIGPTTQSQFFSGISIATPASKLVAEFMRLSTERRLSKVS
ncbi:exosome complex component RRP46-like [Oscarella lobularis]|uniref:exosome complex component RRP46-like n=1 Tax=Oscarella lobularis TaxID=121494 RepID=UPI0033144929